MARQGQDGKPKWKRNAVLSETRLSTLFVCTNLLNNKLFVAKTVPAHDLESRTAIEIERRMYHGYHPTATPYIVKYLGFNLEKNCKEMNNHDVCNMFLEWVPRGSLYQYIHRNKGDLPESAICTFTSDILKGLVELHAQGKVHGDIKASNILVGDKNLKLCDLGSGKILEDGDVVIPPRKGKEPTSKRIFTTGSDGFRAPEVEDEIEQGPPADMYALGCTIVEMATGDPPQRCPRIFQSSDPTERDPETGHMRCSIDLPTHFSKEAFSVLELCLAEDPRDRPTPQALLDHPWFRKFEMRYPVMKLPEQGQGEAEVVDIGCVGLSRRRSSFPRPSKFNLSFSWKGR